MALTEIERSLGQFGPFKCEVVSFNRTVGADATDSFTTNIKDVKGISFGNGNNLLEAYTTVSNDVTTINIVNSVNEAKRLTFFILGY